MSEALRRAIAGCRLCAQHLPHGVRPVVGFSATARLLIIGQAPGSKVHESGIPWNDASGDRLREWLAVDREVFYDESRIAIVPMGFCYPGVDKNGGDAPPRPECAPLWHARVLALMPAIEITLLVGQHAQRYYLGRRRAKTMTETVRNWRAYGPSHLPLPHPSWRNTAWLKRNPWFTDEVLPTLRHDVAALL